VLLVQCCRDNGPQLSAALSATDNDSSHVKALRLLAVIIEHVVFELTDIMVRLYIYTVTRPPRLFIVLLVTRLIHIALMLSVLSRCTPSNSKYTPGR